MAEYDFAILLTVNDTPQIELVQKPFFPVVVQSISQLEQTVMKTVFQPFYFNIDIEVTQLPEPTLILK